MTRNNRIIRRTILKHYDKILFLSDGVADEFSVQRIPIVSLSHIVKLAKVDTNTKSKPVNTLNTNFNKSIDLFLDLCIKRSKVIGDKAISIKEIGIFIETLKTAFRNEFNKNN